MVPVPLGYRFQKVTAEQCCNFFLQSGILFNLVLKQSSHTVRAPCLSLAFAVHDREPLASRMPLSLAGMVLNTNPSLVVSRMAISDLKLSPIVLLNSSQLAAAAGITIIGAHILARRSLIERDRVSSEIPDMTGSRSQWPHFALIGDQGATNGVDEESWDL